jgi:hypothetical protein
MSNPECPHCGADQIPWFPNFYKCRTIGSIRGDLCKEREARQRAEDGLRQIHACAYRFIAELERIKFLSL